MFFRFSIFWLQLTSGACILSFLLESNFDELFNSKLKPSDPKFAISEPKHLKKMRVGIRLAKKISHLLSLILEVKSESQNLRGQECAMMNLMMMMLLCPITSKN